MNNFDNYNLFNGPLAPAAGIVSPPGTYLPPGATAPMADPGGTYTSGYNETAPTPDPAGTYSSPYALNRLIIDVRRFAAQHRKKIFDIYAAMPSSWNTPRIADRTAS